jgi:hypothetical protein
MSSTKISQMSAVTTVEYDAIIPIVQNGENLSATKIQLSANQSTQVSYEGASITFDCSLGDVFRVTAPNLTGFDRAYAWGFTNFTNGKYYQVITNIGDAQNYNEIIILPGVNGNWHSCNGCPGGSYPTFQENAFYTLTFFAIGGQVILTSIQRLQTMPPNI